MSIISLFCNGFVFAITIRREPRFYRASVGSFMYLRPLSSCRRDRADLLSSFKKLQHPSHVFGFVLSIFMIGAFHSGVPSLAGERRWPARFSRWLRRENRDGRMRAGGRPTPAMEHHLPDKCAAFARIIWLRLVNFAIDGRPVVGLFLRSRMRRMWWARSFAKPQDHFSAMPRSGFVFALSRLPRVGHQ
jgi:hypothetical protein